ncbi:GAF domain-containing protein [Asaia prunellae]|uniref:GAF domain-containing protein n=1 Tax=Asaia prunellae TaxID=610245 RepID=UPI000470D365|nr:GAF domain-containing protein [Asaia prunellae]
MVGIAAYDIFDTPPERGYDDLVLLAAQICNTPIAIMSLVGEERQWFKARTGIPFSETSIDSSICRLVVEENGPIEIEDLAIDPRTAGNELVLEAPKIRFYAGMPLRTPFGTIGALAVIDDVARAGGLSVEQRAALEKLAGLVVDLLELRRRSLALAVTQKRWQSLFQTMEEGFFLAQVLRNDAGDICDWVYHEVNPAWVRQVGIPAEVTIGKTYGALFPFVEAEWIDLAAKAVAEDRPVPFLQRVKATGRWYGGGFYPVGQGFFSGTFREVTSEVAAQNRQAGLIALGDVLRDERDVTVMISQAMAVIGEAFSADRATYGELDHHIETLTVAEGWALPGMPPIAGVYRFDDYGRLRETLLAGEALVIRDILTDPRTRDDSQGWLALRHVA